jgi:rod shape-determining protein MreD
MIRFGGYAVLVSVALVLQTTWLTHLSVGGAVADPLLLVVMVVGLLHGPEEGALAGAGVGLLQDIMTGVPLGLGMLGDLCTGFAAGIGQRTLYLESTWLPALGAAILSVLRSIVWIGAAHLVGLVSPSPLHLLRVLVLTACYNGVIAVPIFRGLRRLDSALVRLSERP